jgi:hypothetical protein
VSIPAAMLLFVALTLGFRLLFGVVAERPVRVAVHRLPYPTTFRQFVQWGRPMVVTDVLVTGMRGGPCDVYNAAAAKIEIARRLAGRA